MSLMSDNEKRGVLLIAEQEIVNNGGSVVATGAPQVSRFFAFVHFRTDKGTTIGSVTLDLRKGLTTQKIINAVRAKMRAADKLH
jgi:hypothetical protein